LIKLMDEGEGKAMRDAIRTGAEEVGDEADIGGEEAFGAS
jgi:hypothetical protein